MATFDFNTLQQVVGVLMQANPRERDKVVRVVCLVFFFSVRETVKKRIKSL